MRKIVDSFPHLRSLTVAPRGKHDWTADTLQCISRLEELEDFCITTGDMTGRNNEPATQIRELWNVHQANKC
jgi:hypothetical protein